MAAFEPFDGKTDQEAGVAFVPFSGETDEEKAAREKRPGLVMEGLSQIKDAALYYLPAAAASAIEGDEPDKSQNFLDTLVARGRAKEKAVAEEPGAKDPLGPFGAFSREDVRSLGPSLGFSGAGALAGVGAGVPAAIAGSLATPIAGTIAGYTAGGAANFEAARRMTANRFLRDAREKDNADALKAGAEPLSDTEWTAQRRPLYIEGANKSGLWEAGPETASNLIQLAILSTPAGRFVPKNLIARMAVKGLGMTAAELPSETLTQQGQQPEAVRAGLQPGPERSMTSPGDWWTSFKEIAAPVLLQTAVMGGAGAAGVKGYRMLKGKEDEPNPVAEATNRAAGGDTRPAAATLLNQAVRDVVTGEDTLGDAIEAAAPQETGAPAQPARTDSDELVVLRKLAGTKEQRGILTDEERQTLLERGLVRKNTSGGVTGLPAARRRLKELEAQQPKETESDQPIVNAEPSTPESQPPLAGAEEGPVAPAGQDAVSEGSVANPEQQSEAQVAESQAPATSEPGDGGLAPALAPALPVGDGTRAAPVEVKSAADVERAAAAAATDYTPPQGEANNRALGHLKWNGLDGSIEVPAGGVRKGTNQETGEPWESRHSAPYGYFRETKAADGMHVDAIWGPELDKGHPVYVIDEIDDAGKYRQAKTLPGFASEQAARDAYLGISSKKLAHIGAITAMPAEEFKTWVKSEAALKPVAYGKSALPAPTVADIHKLAESKGVKWDNDPDFIAFTKEVTGKEHLDDLNDDERRKVFDLITEYPGEKAVQPEKPARKLPAQRRAEAAAKKQPKLAHDDGMEQLADKFAEQDAAKDKAKADFGSKNTVFTADAAARARELLRKKLGQVNAGLDPEVIQAGITLAGFHIEAGARTFAAYSAKMIEDLGDAVKPYLKSWYLAVRNYPGFDNAGMQSEAELEAKPASAEQQKPADDIGKVMFAADAGENTEVQVVKAGENKFSVSLYDKDAEQRLQEFRIFEGEDAYDKARDFAREQAKPKIEAAPKAEDSAEKPAESSGERPKDDDGNPIFKKGERVEFYVGRDAGRHGVISDAQGFTMRSFLIGGGRGAQAPGDRHTYTYMVMTDNGAEIMGSPREFRLETAKPENVVPDIKWGAHFQRPDQVWREYQHAKTAARNARERQANARLPAKKREWAAEAEARDEKAAEALAVFHEWKERYPAQAEAIINDGKPAGAQAPSAAPATVAAKPGQPAMTLHESKHTKTGEPLWVVTMADRVERDAYNALNAKAKGLGGYYSSFRGNGAIPGFTFKDEAKAKEFMGQEAGKPAEADPMQHWIDAANTKFAKDNIKISGDKNMGGEKFLTATRDGKRITQIHGTGYTQAGIESMVSWIERNITEKPAEPGKFAISDGLNEAMHELRAASHDKAKPGDIELITGKFVSFEDVVRLAREGIETGAIRPVPAQLHFRLDIMMRDVNRVLKAATEAAAESAKRPVTPQVEALPGTAPLGAKPGDTSYEDGQKWWENDLTKDGRDRVAEHVGIARRVAWRYMTAEDRLKVLAIRGTQDDPAAPQQPAAPVNPMAAAAQALRDAADAVEQAAAPKPAAEVYTEDKAPDGPLVQQGSPDRPGAQTLEGAPSGEVSRPEGSGDAGEGTGGSRGPDAAGNAGVQGLGAEPPRGMAGEPGAAPSAEGGEPGRPDAGQSGVRSDGGSEQGAAGRLTPTNFVITDELDLGKGSQIEKYNGNVAAIRLLKTIESENRQATEAEQRILARYVGWGGIKQAFPNPNNPPAKGWEKRVAEIKELLTPEEHEAAARSIQDAHYTSKAVVEGMWKIAKRLGFDGGKVLESSMGVGNFFGLMPADLRAGAALTGIELDSITARIAKQLYPKANVLGPIGFHEVNLADNAFNLSIGNPPFGDQALYDSNAKHLKGFSIHNFFFAKAIDKLAHGGLHIAVVSRYFMDAQTSPARDYIAHRAELVGAIRLPWTAFSENANTQVVTDIVILKKLPENLWGTVGAGHSLTKVTQASADSRFAWTETVDVPDPLGGDSMRVNSYYAAHPEMVLGQMDRSGEMRFENDITVRPREGQTIEDGLSEVMESLPENIYERGKTAEQVNAEQVAAVVPEDVIEHYSIGQYFEDDGKLLQRVMTDDGSMKAVAITAETPWGEKSTWGDGRLDRLRGMIGIRTMARDLLKAEATDEPDAKIKKMRGHLNKRYDAFVAKHGYLNETANERVFAADPDAPLLLALEDQFDGGISKGRAKTLGIKPRKASAKKMPIFTQRVVRPHTRVTSADNPTDGLALSISEKGVVSIPYIAGLTRQTEQDIVEALTKGPKPQIYFDPAKKGYDLAADYMAGNVKRKYREALDAGLHDQAEALKKVWPEDVKAGDLKARLGSPWIDRDAYEGFVTYLLGEDASATIRHVPATGGFAVHIEGGDPVMLRTRWGTTSRNADDLITRILNSKDLTVYGTDSEGNRFVKIEETQAARDKADEISQEFEDWIFKDPEQRERLVQFYNDNYNTNIDSAIDGSYLKLPGKVPDAVIRLRRHQLNAVARLIRRGKALLDHVVGAGKTFTIIAGVMEKRRLGLSKKPMIVVPNHLVEQWATDFYRLYPGAKVLAMRKKDFEKTNRQRMLARVATGDWDAVIFSHSSFGFIENDREVLLAAVRKQVAEIQQAIDIARATEGKKSRNASQYQKTKEKLEQRIKAMLDKPKDQLLTFQELGVDDLTVDESQEFKNLFFTTQKQNVGGFGNPAGSKKSFDMFIKTQWLQKTQNGRGVAFATGTPVSNSLTELFTLQRYLGMEELEARGLTSLDAWLGAFGIVQSEYESNVTGTKYKRKERLRRLTNVPEIMQLYKEFADSITNDQIKQNYREDNNGEEFPIPSVKSAPKSRANIVVPRTALQAEFSASLQQRMEELKRGGTDNALAILGDGRKAALDMRLVDTSAPDHPGSKTHEAADNIHRIYKEWDKKSGTQLVFLDISTPLKHGLSQAKKYLKEAREILDDKNAATWGTYSEQWNRLRGMLQERMESTEHDDGKGVDAIERFLEQSQDIEAAVTTVDKRFSVYDDMRAKLVERGIPNNEIAFIHDFNGDTKKQELFDMVNAGRVRVLMGSTAKMGAGTNVQRKMVAIHHLDSPWRPSDIEQREGRGIRQGNEFRLADKDFAIEINAYATEGTSDVFFWQTQEQKLNGINSLRNFKGEREIEEVSMDAMSAAEMKALSSGNPLILEDVQLTEAIRKMEGQRRRHISGQQDIESEVRKYEKRINGLPAVIARQEETLAKVRTYQEDPLEGARPTADMDGKEMNAQEADRHVREVLEKAKAVAYEKNEPIRKEIIPFEIDTHSQSSTVRTAAHAKIRELEKTFAPPEWSVTFAEKEYKNQDTVHRAIVKALGDVEAIRMVVGGDSLIRRHDIAEKIGPVLEDFAASPVASSHSLGTIGGMPVELTWLPARGANIPAGVKIEVGGEVDYVHERQETEVRGFKVEAAPVSPNAVLHKIEALISGVEYSLRQNKADLDQAKKGVAPLRAEIGKVWGKDDDLNQKRARLTFVRNELSGENANKAKEKEAADLQGRMDDVRFTSGSSGAVVVSDFTDITLDSLPDIPMFVHKGKDNWVVTHTISGLRLASGDTKKGAIDEANKVVLDVVGEEKVRSVIGEAVAITDEQKQQALRGKFSRDGRQRRAPTGVSGLSPKEVQSIVDKIRGGWKNPPKVKVLATMADAPAPIRQQDEEARAKGAKGVPEAFLYQNIVYVVAEALPSTWAVVRALFHESLGHFGLRGTLGPKMREVLQDVVRSQPDAVRAKAREYGLDWKNEDMRLEAAEEVLAAMAQDKPQAGLVKRAIAAIREFLRKLGFDLKLSNNDIIVNLILPARRMVEQGPGAAPDGRAAMFHRAWHGTPHEVDEFKLRHIGTGEGAQAYGWGMYFAGNREVAEFYKKKLSEPSRELGRLTATKDGRTLTGMELLPEYFAPGRIVKGYAGYDEVVKFKPDDINGFWAVTVKSVKDQFGKAPTTDDARPRRHSTRPDALEVRRVLEAEGWTFPTGRLYEVNLTPKESQYLDWDKPLSAQSQEVKKVLAPILAPQSQSLPAKAFRAMMTKEKTGEGLYRAIERSYAQHLAQMDVDADQAASEYLASIGIPGIRYLDGSSRGKGEGSYNYVLFRDDLISIEGRFSRAAATTSDAFRRWFGDSKVVDENGEPLVVYHGTDREFGTFDGRENPGWFSADATLTERYTEGFGADPDTEGPNIIPVHLAIRKPLDLRGRFDMNDDVSADELAARIPEVVWDYYPDDDVGPAWAGVNNHTFFRELAAAGFDGMVVHEAGAETWAPVRPEQIKSATGNRGTFDPKNPDIRFSRSPTVDDLTGRLREEAGNLLTSQRTFNRFWHRTVGTQFHKATVDKDANGNAGTMGTFGKVFNIGQDYLTDTSRYAMIAEEQAPDLLLRMEGVRDVLPKWLGGKHGISAKDRDAIARPIFEGTLEDKAFTDEELRALYSLTDAQIGHYRQFRASVDRSLEELGKSTMAKMAKAIGVDFGGIMAMRDRPPAEFHDELKALVKQRARTLREALDQLEEDDPQRPLMESRADEADAQSKRLTALYNQIGKLQQQGYAPLMRFGEYTVYVTEGEEQVFFGMYETQREANAAAKALREEYPDAEVSQGILSKEAYRIFAGLSPDTVEVFAKAAGLDQEPLFQEYLRLAVNNRSALKRLIKRKGVPGFSQDATRVLAAFVTSNARLTSSNYHLGQMQAAVDAIPRSKGDVKDEAARLWKYLTDPQEEAGALRGFLFFNFLGGSIASAMVNATQPVTMTAPYLSQYVSAAKVVAELGKASMEAAKNAPGADVRQAYQRAVEEGLVAPHEIYQLMAQARGNVMGSSGMGRFMKVWGSLFSLAEAFNRRTTFIAAYRLAPEGQNRYAFAKRAVHDTQGLYNKGNRPNWARGSVGATIFTFRQFSISYIEFLKRLHDRDQKAFWLALAVLALAAGAEGLPFAEDIEDLLDTIGQWLGYSTNSKKWLKDRTAEALGEGASQFVLHGISAIPGMPLDVSQRMGMQNLIPGTALLKKSDAGVQLREATEILGPAGGLLQNASKAFQAGSVVPMLPTAVQNLFKGASMWEKGYYEDAKGRRVINTTPGEAILKAGGFQPSSVAAESRAIGMAYQDIEINKATEAGIADKWARGIVEKDQDKVEEAKQELRDWNAKNPESPIRINGPQIRRRVLEMRRSRADRFVKSAPPEMRGQVAREIR